MQKPATPDDEVRQTEAEHTGADHQQDDGELAADSLLDGLVPRPASGRPTRRRRLGGRGAAARCQSVSHHQRPQDGAVQHRDRHERDGKLPRDVTATGARSAIRRRDDRYERDDGDRQAIDDLRHETRLPVVRIATAHVPVSG